MTNIHIKTDANVIQLFQKASRVDVSRVGGQQKEVIIVQIIIRNIFQYVKRFQVVTGIREANDVFQLEIGAHIVGGIDEILDLVDMMSSSAIECRRKWVDAMLIG